MALRIEVSNDGQTWVVLTEAGGWEQVRAAQAAHTYVRDTWIPEERPRPSVHRKGRCQTCAAEILQTAAGAPSVSIPESQWSPFLCGACQSPIDQPTRASLVGRTITGVEATDASVTLTLDDGRRVELTAGGYDEASMGVEIKAPPRS